MTPTPFLEPSCVLSISESSRRPFLQKSTTTAAFPYTFKISVYPQMLPSHELKVVSLVRCVFCCTKSDRKGKTKYPSRQWFLTPAIRFAVHPPQLALLDKNITLMAGLEQPALEFALTTSQSIPSFTPLPSTAEQAMMLQLRSRSSPKRSASEISPAPLAPG